MSHSATSHSFLILHSSSTSSFMMQSWRPLSVGWRRCLPGTFEISTGGWGSWMIQEKRQTCRSSLKGWIQLFINVHACAGTLAPWWWTRSRTDMPTRKWFLVSCFLLNWYVQFCEPMSYRFACKRIWANAPYLATVLYNSNLCGHVLS